MVYRDGTPEDYPYIREFIGMQGYFTEIDPSTLGGQWLLATHDGKIHATVWCFYQAPHAYIDYWAGRGKAAARLGIIAEKRLRDSGIRYVRGVIQQDNSSAHRLATTGIGMSSGPNFYLVFKELADGRPNNHNGNDDTGSIRPGAEPIEAVPGSSTESTEPAR